MNIDKQQKRCSTRAKFGIYFLTMMICIFQSSITYATDLLVIEEIELVKDAEVVGIQSWVGKGEAFKVTLKGGVGICADKTIIINLDQTFSREQYQMHYRAALTALSLQLKNVSLGSYLGEKDCNKVNYIKLTRSSD